MVFSDVFSRIKWKLEQNELDSSITKLNQLKNLLYQGKSHELLDAFKQVKKIGEITQVASIETQILEVLILYEQGEFQSGLKLTETIINLARQSEDRLSELNVLLLKIKAEIELGELKTCLNLISKAEDVLRLFDDNLIDYIRTKESDLYYLKTRVFLRKADYDNAFQFAEKVLMIRKEDKRKYDIAECLNLIGIISNAKGEYEKANEYLQESLRIFQDFDNKKAVTKILNNLGMSNWSLGNLLKALDFFQRSLSLAEELENLNFIAVSNLNIGLVYVNLGKFNAALKNFQTCLAISEELGGKRPLSLCLNNMGLIYHRRGDLKQALSYYEESLTLNQEIGNNHDIAICYNNIGEILHSMGDYDRAFEQIEKSLVIFRKLGLNLDLTLPLFNLVDLSLESKLPQKAQSYLQQLQEINVKEKHRLISQRYRLAKALVLKYSHRAKMKISSSEILEELIAEEIIDHSLTVRAMFESAELLIDELRAYGEEEILKEIKKLIKHLDEIAKKQNSHSLVIDTMVLQAKLSMVEGDLNASQQLLDRVEVIVEEKEIPNLADKVVKEKEKLKNQYENWENLIQSNAPFGLRLEQAQVSEYINEAKKAKREWAG